MPWSRFPVRDQRVRLPWSLRLGRLGFRLGASLRPTRGNAQGLTKDDFILLDQGKPQKIAVFNDGAMPRVESRALALPPGAVSYSGGGGSRTMHGATVVFIDFLNSRAGGRGYERVLATARKNHWWFSEYVSC